VVEVASEFTALKRQGANYSGLCPYPDHNEKTPSFSVNPEKGFYYCFGCLEENERIWTSRGLVPIGKVRVGDEVIGLDGRRETVADKVSKTGPTLKIRTGAAKEGLELTPDHWCVVVEREEVLRNVPGVHRRYGDREEIRFSSKLQRGDAHAALSVVRASDVEPGDFWLYPVLPEGERADLPLSGEHAIKPYTKGPKNERLTGLHVNPDTAWLYGLWLAEGSLYRGGAKWSFGAHEAGTLAARAVRVLREELGRPATVFTRPEKNICEVACSSTDLAALLAHWFGRGCDNKRIPIEALNWTPECQVALIEGYLAGDATVSGDARVATTVSEELAYGIFALCVQSGKICSTSSRPAYVGKDGVKRRKSYTVSILGRESLRGFYARLNGTTYYWSVISEVFAFGGEGTRVVDITTTGSHTFLTKTGITHNCQRGGDAIKLLMELRSLSFAEAVTYLAERANIELSMEGRSPEDEQAARRAADGRRAARKALAAAAVYYHKYLIQSPNAEPARAYLQGRGFTRSTIEEFRLGYAPQRGVGGFSRVAGRVGLGRGALDAAGLVSARGGERFADRVTFPISDRQGRVLGFGARALGDAKPKYLNSPETDLFNKRALLYGFPQVGEAIRRSRTALVVEGYTDVLMLYQSGIKNAVATLGTALTEQHLRTLSGYADEIYLLFDPDAAGEKAVERAAVISSGLKLDLRVLRLEADPADWLLEHPAEEFAALLGGAVPVLRYVFDRRDERLRGANTAERARAFGEMKALIAEIEDPVFRRDAIRQASESLGLSPKELLAGLRGGDGPVSLAPRRTREQAPRDPYVEAGSELLAHALASPGLAAGPLREGVAVPGLDGPFRLSEGDFATEIQGRIFALLRDRAGEDTEAVLADERARPLLDEISALRAAGKGLPTSRAVLEAAFLRLGAVSREKAKLAADDLDEKTWLQTEAKMLNQAAVEASIHAVGSVRPLRRHKGS